MLPRLRHLLLPRRERGSLRRLLRAGARRIWSERRLDDPLDGGFLPYRGLGRRSLTVLLDATNKCNLRCTMCHFALEETRREPLVRWTTDDVDALERDVLPHARRVFLSAGTEPLVWPHFPRLLYAVRRARVPRVELITNGLLLTDELAERIVAARVTRVQLSIDGATKETYESIRAGADFERFVEALERLRAAKRRARSRRPALQFNVTLMRRNVDELEDLLRLARRHGVASIDLRHVVVDERLDVERESLVHDKPRAHRALARARSLAAELGLELVRWPEDFVLDEGEEAHAPEAPHALEEMVAPKGPAAEVDAGPADTQDADAVTAPPSGPRPSHARELDPAAMPSLDLAALPARPICDLPWRQMCVRPDRTVVPCCFWYTGEPLGDLAHEDFDEVWQGDGFRRLRQQILTGELGPNCAACPSLGAGCSQGDAAYRALARP